MSESTLFKDNYNLELAQELAARITTVYPSFDPHAFVSLIDGRLEMLELKERVALFAAGLHQTLPAYYPQAVALLLQIMGPELQEEPETFGDLWFMMPIAYFVEAYGLDHYDVSMAAMYEITKRHSSEFAIRPFLNRYPEQTLAVLHEWAGDPNPHVRRLVSEGTRPRLPWAGRLYQFIEDPSPTLALLEKLKDDPSAYVRRSVANHLNDIAKDHPALVVETCRRWQAGASEGTHWIIRHALRSLIKAGDPGALALLGFGDASVSLHNFTITPAAICLGEAINLSFVLQNESQEGQNLVIDYVVHLVKAGGRTSPKVFKLTTRTLAGGESAAIRRRHLIKPITTRRYYPGEHRVEIQVNGRILGSSHFLLEL